MVVGKHNNNVIGSMAEDNALNYLKKKHYKILTKNYKCAVGEIDIIARYKDTLVFVEVKYSEDLFFGNPSERVTIFKKNKIKNVSKMYLIANSLYENTSIRFDVIEIIGSKINHIINAF